MTLTVLTLSVIAYAQNPDSSSVIITPVEDELRTYPWLEWGEWLDIRPELKYISSGLLGHPATILSLTGPMERPYLHWQELPLFDHYAGFSDVSLIPADAVVDFNYDGDHYNVKTRRFSGVRPLSRFHYRTLNKLNDFDITFGINFSKKISCTVAGFQQRIKADDKSAISINEQKLNRGLAELNIQLNPSWNIGYSLLRNQVRIDTVSSWNHPLIESSILAPKYRRLRFDHRFNVTRTTRSSWTNSINIGLSSDRHTWIDRTAGSSVTISSKDAQFKWTLSSNDSIMPLKIGIWAVSRQSKLDDLKQSYDSWGQCFINADYIFNNIKFESSLAILFHPNNQSKDQWNALGRLRISYPITSKWYIFTKFHRDVQPLPSGNMYYYNNCIYPGITINKARWINDNSGKASLPETYTDKGQALLLGSTFNSNLLLVKISFNYSTRTIAPFHSLMAIFNPESISYHEYHIRGFTGEVNFKIHKSLTLLSTTNKNNFVNYFPIFYHPEWTGHAALIWKKSFFKSDLIMNTLIRIKYWSEYDIYSPMSDIWQRQTGDFQLDSKISMQLIKNAWLGFSYENMLNIKYKSYSHISAVGRTFRLGLIWELLD
ncbi:hypothetical protein KAR48_18395 [bacterium]|nr:hypothetical protein [bacterium]